MPLPVVVALRLLSCAAFTWLVWRWLGVVSLVLCAPLFGVALARPVLEMVGNTVLLAKRLGYRKINGRHFEHQGRSIDIADDDEGYRWLKTEDVRKVVAGLPTDPVLVRLFPGEVRPGAAREVPRMKAEALDAYLAKATEAGSLRFRLWLQREVILPARLRRERGSV
jgi:hypothetical protein